MKDTVFSLFTSAGEFAYGAEGEVISKGSLILTSIITIMPIALATIDFSENRNVIIAAVIMVLALGIKFSAASAISFSIGSVNISLSGLAVAAIVGIVLNAVLPGNDYAFGKNLEGDTSVNCKV